MIHSQLQQIMDGMDCENGIVVLIVKEQSQKNFELKFFIKKTSPGPMRDSPELFRSV